jgi:hypothetical protein
MSSQPSNNLAVNMLLIMVSVMVLFGLINNAIISENEEAFYFNYSKTLGGQLTGSGGLDTDLKVDYGDVELEGGQVVEGGSNNLFTDTIRSVQGWFQKQQDKFRFAGSMLRQPAGFMKDVGVPQVIVTAFGTIWYLIMSLALLMLATGRN